MNKFGRYIKDLYCDQDGVWCILKEGFTTDGVGGRTFHCETYAELTGLLKSVPPVKSNAFDLER